MSKTREEEIRERYRELTGREPEDRFPDDPDWQYRGGKGEFAELQRRMGLLDEEDGPVKIDGQEELFSQGTLEHEAVRTRP